MSQSISPLSDVPFDLLAEPLVSAEEITTGHIHRTWRVVDSAGAKWAVQQVSTGVFPEPDALAENLRLVTVAARGAGVPTLEPVGVGPESRPTLWRDEEVWRASRWIPGRRLSPGDPDDVRLAATAFGRFDAALGGLDGLVEVLPRFHHPMERFERLNEALSRDRVDRAATADDLVGRLEQIRSKLFDQFSSWVHLPVRVAHNDAKSTNVLVEPDGRAVVIDLDTVMPGTVLSDIGEMVRSTLRPVEDVADDNPIDTSIVGEIVGGFTRAFGPLTSDERDTAAYAGVILTTENAVRFLTDFLDGDVYYSVDDPGHNLRRALAQTALAERLSDASAEIVDVVAAALSS